MTHLPECFASLCECDDTHFKSIDCDFSCICPSLRACEQRVLDLNPVALGVLIAQRARERALEDAREAAFNTRGWFTDEYPDSDGIALPVALIDDVVNRIDALRKGKP